MTYDMAILQQFSLVDLCQEYAERWMLTYPKEVPLLILKSPLLRTAMESFAVGAYKNPARIGELDGAQFRSLDTQYGRFVFPLTEVDEQLLYGKFPRWRSEADESDLLPLLQKRVYERVGSA